MSRWNCLLVLYSIFLLGCDPGSSPRSAQTPSVRIWSVGPQGPGFETYTFQTLPKLEKAEGAAGSVYLRPLVSREEIQRGPSVKLRLSAQADGSLLPLDADTMAVLSSYAGLEKSFLLAKNAGFSSEELAGAGVFLFPQFQNRHKSFSMETIHRLETSVFPFYFPLSKGIVFPSGESSHPRVPQHLNPGVVSHEYVHFLVDRMWKSSSDLVGASKYGSLALPGTLSEVELEELEARKALLRGLEEGVGDLWAWLVTQNLESLEYSFPQALVRQRRLDGGSVGPGIHQNFRTGYFQSKLEGDMQAYFYGFGSRFARRIFCWVLVYQSQQNKSFDQVRAPLAQALMSMLRAQIHTMTTVSLSKQLAEDTYYQDFARAWPEMSRIAKE